MPMLKDQVSKLLTILIDDFKFRIEASSNEIDLVVQRMIESQNVTIDSASKILKGIK